MPKKNNAVEILKPLRPAPNIRAQLDAYIEQKIAEIIGADKTGLFQPFFQRKEIAREIKKLETVPQQRKWHSYFDEWGCLVCAEKDRQYVSGGMCAACYSRVKMRLQTIVRFMEIERPDATPLDPGRLTDLAQSASQAPAADEDSPRGLFVAAGIEPVEVETRDYITKAERRAQRKAQRQRGVAMREKRSRRAETLRQAVEQGLTCREIAQRDDPDFLDDPEAATERTQHAAYRNVPPAVRAQRLHERSARRAEIWRQARNLHVEQGLTWREIAQRLDPEGFAKDPKAAMARMITGSRSVSMVRDLTDVARAALNHPPRPLPPEKFKDVESIAREARRPARKALPARTSPKHTRRSR